MLQLCENATAGRNRNSRHATGRMHQDDFKTTAPWKFKYFHGAVLAYMYVLVSVSNTKWINKEEWPWLRLQLVVLVSRPCHPGSIFFVLVFHLGWSVKTEITAVSSPAVAVSLKPRLGVLSCSTRDSEEQAETLRADGRPCHGSTFQYGAPFFEFGLGTNNPSLQHLKELISSKGDLSDQGW